MSTLALSCVGLAIGPVAFADDDSRTSKGELTWQLRTLDSRTVYSGDSLYYQVGVQCSSGSGACANTTVRLTAPIAASAHGVLDGALPTDGSITVDYEGNDVLLHYHGEASTAGAGTTRYFNLFWPTANGITAPGDQQATMTVTTDGETQPWPDQPVASIPLTADSTLTVTKTGAERAYYDEEYRYSIRATVKGADAGSIGHGVLNVASTVRDPIPAGANFVRCENATGCGYDPATRTVTWSGTVLGASPKAASQEIGIVVIFPADGDDSPGHTVAPTDTPVRNTVTATGTQVETGKELTDSASATTTLVQDVPATVAPALDKTPQSSGKAWQDQTNFAWNVTVTNRNPVSASARIVDKLPAGFNLTSVRTSACRPGTEITFTHADGATTTLPLACTTVDTASSLTVPPQDLSAHGRVAKVELTVGKLKPNQKAAFSLYTTVHVDDFDATTPAQLRNCASASTTGPDGVSESVDKCANAMVTAHPLPGFRVTKTTENKAWNPGDTFTWEISFANTANNGSVMTPDLYDLIPPALTYVPHSLTLVPAKSLGFCPSASQFTETISTDWKPPVGSATKTVTKVNWKAEDDVAVPYQWVSTAPNNTCYYTISTTVNPGTAPGSYSGTSSAYDTYRGNAVYLTDVEFMPRVIGYESEDGWDVNDNGETTNEVMASHGASFQVSTKAQLWVDGRVSGDRDLGGDGRIWLDSAEKSGHADQVGSASPGGDISYQVRLGNLGNEPLTHVVAYNLLPAPGNTGVTAARYHQSPPGNGNEWIPAMTGPIDTATLPAPVAKQLTITYSATADPCRPEMDNAKASVPQIACDGVDASFVPADQVADWSAIRAIRFDFGAHRFAGGENYAFTWTMAAPTTTAAGDDIVGGERTWNKVAVQGDQIKADGSVTPLLAAEYPWLVGQMFVAEPADNGAAIAVKKWSSADGSIAAGDYNDVAKQLTAGQPTAITVTVQNTGEEALKNVTVSDKTTLGNVTIADLSCDFSPLGGPTSGTSYDGPFEVGASFTCTGTLGALAIGDHHSDTVTAEGTGIDSGVHVSAEDPWNGYVPTDGPAIDIRKFSTSQGAGAGDHDNAPGKALVAGEDEPITFTVTNTGSETLTNLVVRDATTVGPTSLRDLSCDFSALGGPTSGTTSDGSFQPGAAFECTAILPGLAAGEEHSNTASVTAVGQGSGQTVEASDPWNGFAPIATEPEEAAPEGSGTGHVDDTSTGPNQDTSPLTPPTLAMTGASGGPWLAVLALALLIAGGLTLRLRTRRG